ncbi:hypothetical protein [Chlorogloea sp. CCALA 695]|uniref:hypothetical protein n=1 Tax=Chlorogloea sp. CCALA 695 TaxID=2107693 RepID=UPI001304DA5E|nr:hypothetical protein [Chlorogloea sp. CCALA 695]
MKDFIYYLLISETDKRGIQRIRGDIVSANTDLQFDVRDSVEPVYRELMYYY